MPAVDYREVRALVSMQQVLDLLRFVVGTSVGDQLRGPCPLHESASPRSRVFSVNLAKNTFQCFKCRAAGNHLDLWAKTTQQTLYDAAVDLCNRLDRPVPWLQCGTEKRNP